MAAENISNKAMNNHEFMGMTCPNRFPASSSFLFEALPMNGIRRVNKICFTVAVSLRCRDKPDRDPPGSHSISVQAGYA